MFLKTVQNSGGGSGGTKTILTSVFPGRSGTSYQSKISISNGQPKMANITIKTITTRGDQHGSASVKVDNVVVINNLTRSTPVPITILNNAEFETLEIEGNQDGANVYDCFDIEIEINELN